MNKEKKIKIMEKKIKEFEEVCRLDLLDFENWKKSFLAKSKEYKELIDQRKAHIDFEKSMLGELKRQLAEFKEKKENE